MNKNEKQPKNKTIIKMKELSKKWKKLRQQHSEL